MLWNFQGAWDDIVARWIMLNLVEEIMRAFSTKHRRVNVCFVIKETGDTPWYGVFPISRSLSSKGLFSNFQINWSDRRFFLRHRREWLCPCVSFFPVAIGMLMSRDHRRVHCSLMITSPCTVSWVPDPSGQWRTLVFRQPIITVKSGGSFEVLSVQEGGIS